MSCPQGAETGSGGGGADARRISAEESNLWSNITGCGAQGAGGTSEAVAPTVPESTGCPHSPCIHTLIGS